MMKPFNQGLNIVSKLLLVILLLASALFVVSFIFVATSRMGYTYELEWMEGGTLEHVRRVLEGLPLYVQPSLGFTPYIYTPFYYYLSAPLLALLGGGFTFTPLRLVSFLSTLGSLGVIFLLVKLETKRWIFGALAAGMFAATFALGGYWFDLARTDSLFLFLLLLSAYLVRKGDDGRYAVAAGVVMFLSFYSKQAALATALAMSIYSLVYYKRWARFAFPAVFLALLVGSTLFMDWRSRGWYSYYIFSLPNQHVLHRDMLPSILGDDLARPLPVLLLLNGVYFIYLLVRRRWRTFVYYGLLCGSLIGASILSRMHSGGFVNVLIPAYAALAVGFGLGVGELMHEEAGARSKSQWMLSLVQIAVLAACLAQFGLLYSDLRQQIPTQDDVRAGNELVARIDEIDGEVYIPYHSYIAEMAGKAPTAQGMALEDVFRSQDETIRDDLKAEIRRAIENRRFAAIILDGKWRFVAEIDANYWLEGDLFNNDVFWTYSGMITRPNLLYLRKGD